MGPKALAKTLRVLYTKSMKKTLWACGRFRAVVLAGALVSLSAAPLFAQWKPVVQKTVKTAAEKASRAAERPFPASALTKNRAARPAMSESSKRLYYTLMTKAGVSKRKALETLYKRGAVPSAYPMPRLSGEEIWLAQLPAAPISAYKQPPAYPFTNPKRVFYRGISVSSDGLRNILKNGLRAKDSGTHHSDFDIITYQTKAILDLAQKDARDAKNICLIDDSRRAADYAIRRLEDLRHVPIVIQVKKDIPHQLNPAGAGVLSAGDITPDKIVRVSALLTLNGRAVWGDVSMSPEGEFLFRPYAQ